MLRRNRDINIFSMSALDLFASALGAFILLTLILMPYYLKTDKDLMADLQQCREALAESEAARQALQTELQANQQAAQRAQEALEESQQALAQCQQQQEASQQAQEALAQCQQQHDQCLKQLAQTFLAVVIQWETARHDVDLHVVDPTGAEFYFQRKRISGRPGELSADTTQGPGVEIWEVVNAPPGTYKVYYRFYAKKGNPQAATVKGAVYYRGGHHRLSPVTLNAEGEKPLVATLEVNENGDIDIRQ